MIVCKFGGSSVADAEHVKQVKSILEANKHRTLLVVSAPGKRHKHDEKVTDMLYACNEAVQRGGACAELFEKVKVRYQEIMIGLGMDVTLLDAAFAEVHMNIQNGAGANYAASRGEYLCARMIAAWLGWEFIDAADYIVVNHDGTVGEETWNKFSKVFSPKKKYVIPGFYGASREGMVKTFSRGGSDITGAIIARAAGVKTYENWTDVSGVFMADPRIVPEAKPIKELTYREVRELAEVGASVFHEEAMVPVLTKEIPINVKNTNMPSDPGTMIVPERNTKKQKLAGVSTKLGFSRLAIHKMLLLKRPGSRHALLTMLHVFGVRPEFSLFGIDSVVWYFNSSQASENVIEALKTRMKEEFALESIVIEEGYAVAGIVGEGVLQTEDLVYKTSSALEKESIAIDFFNYGASRTSALIGLKEADAKKAVQTLYSALFT